MQNNFYVDDCLFSKPTVEEAVNSSLQLMALLKKGNFRLTKFASGKIQVLASIPAEERTIKDLDLNFQLKERLECNGTLRMTPSVLKYHLNHLVITQEEPAYRHEAQPLIP